MNDAPTLPASPNLPPLATHSVRAGRYITQPTHYKAFIPADLPPNPPLAMDAAMLELLSCADRALGRLDGIAEILPNPDLFVAMFVRHESVLSSQIEGTQSTLEDVLQYEIAPDGQHQTKDIQEVVNYVRAMNHGLQRLPELPLSLRLLREIHAELMQGVRGGEKTPGEFRVSQNWIGGCGEGLKNAVFIPPPPYEMLRALDNLERFLHDRTVYPPLIRCGLAHAQFETIHPFLDGNGRIGRLLITLLLCEAEVLRRPLLYLSYYLKLNKQEYYERLMAIRLHGDWEGWLTFFLKGIASVSAYATATARNILAMREAHRARFAEHALVQRLLDILLKTPLITVRNAAQQLDVSSVTSRSAIVKLEQAGLVKEITGFGRNRLYRYQPYIDLFLAQENQAADAAATVAHAAR